MSKCEVCCKGSSSRTISGVPFCEECFGQLQKMRQGDLNTISYYSSPENYTNSSDQAKAYLLEQARYYSEKNGFTEKVSFPEKLNQTTSIPSNNDGENTNVLKQCTDILFVLNIIGSIIFLIGMIVLASNLNSYYFGSIKAILIIASLFGTALLLLFAFFFKYLIYCFIELVCNSRKIK